MKKQIMSIVLAVSMMVSLFALPVVAADDPVSRAIFVTDNEIVVDGKLDEDYLESDKIVSIYTWKDTKNTALAFEGYGVATKAGFYFWLEIKGDTTYVNSGTTNLHDYGGNNRDYLQVYYNMSVAGKTDYIGYIMHDYRNSLYFRNPTGSNAPGYSYTAPTGFQSAAEKTSTGWISEMFIPWTDGTPAKAGMEANDLNTYFSIGFQYNDDYDGNNDYDCAVYDKNTTSYWSDYTLMCPTVFFRSFGRLSKTNVFFDGDLALDYNVNLGGSYPAENMAVRYTIKGADGTATHTVKGKLVDPEKDTYNFTLNIAPQRMNDTILVELLNGKTVIHKQAEYTVRDFCIKTLNSSKEALNLTENQHAAAQRVALDLLNFGAMAQQYNKYDVANLANVGYEKDFEDVEIEYDDVIVSEKAKGYDNIDLVSYNIYFDGETRLLFKVKADAADLNNVVLSVYAGGGKPATYYSMANAVYDAANGVYEFYTNPIDPSDYDHNYTVRLEYIKDLGTDWESFNIVQSVKCSVNAYFGEIVKTSTNADMIALAKAAYCLGVSADNMSKA